MALDYPTDKGTYKREARRSKRKRRETEAEVGVMGPTGQGEQATSQGAKDKETGSPLTSTTARGWICVALRHQASGNLLRQLQETTAPPPGPCLQAVRSGRRLGHQPERGFKGKPELQVLRIKSGDLLGGGIILEGLPQGGARGLAIVQNCVLHEVCLHSGFWGQILASLRAAPEPKEEDKNQAVSFTLPCCSVCPLPCTSGASLRLCGT